MPRPARRRAQAVVFDCDGTLVDSEPLARVAWDRALAPYGHAVDAEYAGLVGLSFARVHAHFAERIPGLAGPDALFAAYSEELFALYDRALEPFADALETVAALRAQGIAVAVASSSPRVRLDRTLARVGLEDAFAVTVAGDEVEHGKPAPDMFLAAAAGLGVAPADCVAVEDSGPGVAAGLAAGMRTVAIVRHGVPDGAFTGAHAVLARLSADAVLGRREGASA